MLRRVKSLQKQVNARKRAFSHVWWMSSTWQTGVEEVLTEAARQGLTFGALDTEYRVDAGTGVVLTEVGFSCYRQGEFYDYHYAVAGGKGRRSKKFNHGVTHYYPLKKFLLEELRRVTGQADLILFWRKDNDLRALRTMGFELPGNKVVDVVEWKTPTEGEAGGTVSYYSLKKFCRLQGVRLSRAHNAGNDAHALLDAVLHALGLRGDSRAGTEGDTADAPDVRLGGSRP